MKNIILAIILTASTAAFSQNTHTVIKQCLDSIVTSYSKAFFSYDNKGNNILTILHGHDTVKDVFIYDDNNNLITNISHNWNTVTNVWTEMSKSEFTYNSNNDILTEYIEPLFEYDLFEYDLYELQPYKKENTYDNNGNRTLEIENNYGELVKHEYTYDDNGNQTTKIDYKWNWNKAVNDWKQYYRTEYTYGENKKITMMMSYSWDNATNDWIGREKYEFTYDNNGNKITETCHIWTENDCIGDYRREFAYENDNQTMEIFSLWDNAANDFIKKSKTEYIFDLSYFRTDLIFPIAIHYVGTKINYVGTNMLTKSILYKWSGTDYKQENITNYHWSAKEIIVNSE